MTPQERDMLSSFLNQMVQVQGMQKDPEADALIRQAVQQQPDAAYLLVQKALLQQQALNNAQAQIAQLQRQVQQGNPSGQSFMGGGGDPYGAQQPHGGVYMPTPPQGQGQAYQQQPQYQQPPYQQQPGYAPQMPPQQQAPQQPSRWSGFLGNAAATAAGVAGGQFLFQGLSGLFGHHGGGGFGGGDYGGMPQETIVNNYYGDQGGTPPDQGYDPNANYQDTDYQDDYPDDGGGDGGNDDGSSWI